MVGSGSEWRWRIEGGAPRGRRHQHLAIQQDMRKVGKKNKKSVIGRRQALHGILGCNWMMLLVGFFIFLALCFLLPFLVRPFCLVGAGSHGAKTGGEGRFERADVFFVLSLWRSIPGGCFRRG